MVVRVWGSAGYNKRDADGFSKAGGAASTCPSVLHQGLNHLLEHRWRKCLFGLPMGSATSSSGSRGLAGVCRSSCGPGCALVFHSAVWELRSGTVLDCGLADDCKRTAACHPVPSSLPSAARCCVDDSPCPASAAIPLWTWSGSGRVYSGDSGSPRGQGTQHSTD